MPCVTDGAHVNTFAQEAFLPFDSKALRDRPRSLQVLRTFAIWLAFWIFVGLMFMGQDVTRRLFLDDPTLWRRLGFWTMRVVLSAALTLVILWLGTSVSDGETRLGTTNLTPRSSSACVSGSSGPDSKRSCTHT